jgi:nucleoside 2-deoxyribosyltransferase
VTAAGKRTIYLASPLGFADATLGFMRELETALAALAVVHNPWTAGDFGAAFAAVAALTDRREHARRLHDLDMRIAAGNEAAIRRCDFVVAVLDGVDVDSGTASEIGFAYGLGKRSYGLRTDSRLAGDNPGALVNLQVQYWIEASGGHIVTTVGDLLAALREE